MANPVKPPKSSSSRKRKKSDNQASGDGQPQLPATGAAHAAQFVEASDAQLSDILERAIQVDARLKQQTKGANTERANMRAVYKDAAKYGFERTDIDWALKNKDRDVLDLDAETRRRNRICKLLKVPVGTTLGLLEDGTTVATAIENTARPTASAASGIPTTEDLDRAEDEGRAAGKRGEWASKCKYEEGSPMALRWLKGHAEGQADNAPGQARATDLAQTETVATA